MADDMEQERQIAAYNLNRIYNKLRQNSVPWQPYTEADRESLQEALKMTQDTIRWLNRKLAAGEMDELSYFRLMNAEQATERRARAALKRLDQQ